MELLEASKALSNQTRIRLVQLVAEQPGSSIKIHERYRERYDDPKHRESIYRSLNKLSDAGILEKEYNNEKNEIEYTLNNERFVIDLRSATINPD